MQDFEPLVSILDICQSDPKRQTNDKLRGPKQARKKTERNTLKRNVVRSLLRQNPILI